MRRIITFIIACVLIVSCGTSFATVIDQSLFKTDMGSNEANWKLRSDGKHMGSKSFYYQMSTAIDNLGYQQYINGAITLWGSNMALTNNQSVSDGRFTRTTDQVFYKITRYNVNSSTKEVYEWTISLGYYTEMLLGTNSTRYPIAQSLGFVYGLATVSSSYAGAMNSGSISAPNSYDRKGLSVVTHHHNHMANFTGSDYRPYGSSLINHRQVCTTCQGYLLDPHTFGPVHAGTYTCTLCGFTTTTPPTPIS